MMCRQRDELVAAVVEERVGCNDHRIDECIRGHSATLVFDSKPIDPADPKKGREFGYTIGIVQLVVSLVLVSEIYLAVVHRAAFAPLFVRSRRPAPAAPASLAAPIRRAA